jgi:hypothetical protein
MWVLVVIRDGTVLAHRSDTVLHDVKEKTCLLIDIATPYDSNINTKEAEKLSKYKDLEIEVSRKWTVRTKTLPVIVGALGTIKKGIGQNLQLLPGNPSAIELQKIVLISTAHIIHKALA